MASAGRRTMSPRGRCLRRRLRKVIRGHWSGWALSRKAGEADRGIQMPPRRITREPRRSAMKLPRPLSSARNVATRSETNAETSWPTFASSGSEGRREWRSAPASRAARSAASSIEATEGGFNLGIAGELAALGLGKAFQHGGQMRGINLLGLAVACGKLKHGAGDLVLAAGRQAAHRFESLFKELGHGHSLGIRAGDMKGLQKNPARRTLLDPLRPAPDLGEIRELAQRRVAARRL